MKIPKTFKELSLTCKATAFCKDCSFRQYCDFLSTGSSISNSVIATALGDARWTITGVTPELLKEVREVIKQDLALRKFGIRKGIKQ